jgi:ubiquinol-cytochrome c reductase cytochrome b subunit
MCKKAIKWFDDRLPIFSYVKEHLVDYKAPKNLNWMWSFGSLAGVALVLQILTGIFLAMHYKPDINLAFDSIQHIMRDVEGGWIIRYLHATGASFFFIVVYLHIGRGMYYGSYKSPREVLWWMGIILFFMMMATAFMGYVLPWGQMSYWGAKVITSLFSVIPFIGEDLVVWLWGGFNVGDPTLNRFFSLHYLFPFLIVGVVFLHLWALHHNKSNNPTGKDLKKKEDFISFHPYYTAKDTVGIALYLIPFCFMVFFLPDYLGHADNYIPANPLQTPPHIVPEWYFLPFYAILRAIPIKALGVVAMGASIAILFVLPWLDRSKVRSGRYRPTFQWMFLILVIDFLVLGWIGSKPPEGSYIIIGQVATAIYFAYFLLLPIVSKFEKTKPIPEEI